MYVILDDGVPISRTQCGGLVYETVDDVCEAKRELERRFRFRSGWTQAQIARNTPYSISLAPEEK